MPNWCYNKVTFSHDDPNEITRLINAAKVGKLFNEFCPMPPELLEEAEPGENYGERRSAIEKRNLEKYNYSSWYDWSIDNWGTKWDISEMDDDDNFMVSEDGKTVSFTFDTAWAPPTEWYDNIDGFLIEAYYYEPGVGFCGKWTSEDGDDQYEVSFEDDIEDIEERIPSDILDEFGIIDEIRDWKESMAEEDEDIDDIEDGDMIDPTDRMQELADEFEAVMASEEDENKKDG